jgi:hypothetical protein
MLSTQLQHLSFESPTRAILNMLPDCLAGRVEGVGSLSPTDGAHRVFPALRTLNFRVSDQEFSSNLVELKRIGQLWVHYAWRFKGPYSSGLHSVALKRAFAWALLLFDSR